MESRSAGEKVRTCNGERAEDKQKVRPACPATEQGFSRCTGKPVEFEISAIALPRRRCPRVELAVDYRWIARAPLRHIEAYWMREKTDGLADDMLKARMCFPCVPPVGPQTLGPGSPGASGFASSAAATFVSFGADSLHGSRMTSRGTAAASASLRLAR